MISILLENFVEHARKFSPNAVISLKSITGYSEEDFLRRSLELARSDATNLESRLRSLSRIACFMNPAEPDHATFHEAMLKTSIIGELSDCAARIEKDDPKLALLDFSPIPFFWTELCWQFDGPEIVTQIISSNLLERSARWFTLVLQLGPDESTLYHLSVSYVGCWEAQRFALASTNAQIAHGSHIRNYRFNRRSAHYSATVPRSSQSGHQNATHARI